MPGYIFVHAGLEEGAEEGYGCMSVAEQLALLRSRTSISRPEMLCGREYVMRTPSSLIDQRITVVSGSHSCSCVKSRPSISFFSFSSHVTL
jgi:hypothetical protein